MVITQDDTARSPSVAAPDARFLKNEIQTCTLGPASHANLSGRQGASAPPRVLQQISKPVSQPSFKGRETKEDKLDGSLLALPGLGAEGGGGGGSSTLTDVGLNNQLRVFANKNFRKSAVVGCLVGRCTKGKVPGWGPGCIATPSTANYPSTPLIAVLTISHSSGSLPLVPAYQRFLFNASSILKHRLRA